MYLGAWKEKINSQLRINKQETVILEFYFVKKVLIVYNFYQITSIQVIKEKFFKSKASLNFYFYVYACCLTAWYESRLKS